MAKQLKSIDEIHNTIKRRLFADECVPLLVGLDNQVKYVSILHVVIFFITITLFDYKKNYFITEKLNLGSMTGAGALYLTGKFANCAPEISKIYYKIYREHQNCAAEISVAQYKLSRLGCIHHMLRVMCGYGEYLGANFFLY